MDSEARGDHCRRTEDIRESVASIDCGHDGIGIRSFSLSNRIQSRPPFASNIDPLGARGFGRGIATIRMRMRRRCRSGVRAQPEQRSDSGGGRNIFPRLWRAAPNVPALRLAGRPQERFLNRQLVLPVSTISQWCVNRSSMAVVILASPINSEYPHCRWIGVRSADYLSAPWAVWPSPSDRGAEIRARPKIRHGAVARWP